MKTGIIYITKCKTNGKVYAGQTTKSLQKRSARHISDAFSLKCKAYNSKFYRAMRKYGKDNFVWRVIYNNIPVKNLSDLEISTIKKFTSYKNGYNSTIGGEATFGYRHLKESKIKISAGLGEKRSKTTKAKMSAAASGANNAMYGKKHANKTIKKMSEVKAGKYNGADNPMYGKRHSADTIDKITYRKREKAKLTLAIAEQIRNKYSTGNCTQKSLSILYGVSISTISSIVRYKTWVGEL